MNYRAQNTSVEKGNSIVKRKVSVGGGKEISNVQRSTRNTTEVKPSGTNDPATGPVVSQIPQDMKIHRGPLNLNAVTMRDPRLVADELLNILQSLSVNVKPSSEFSFKCEFRNLKFLVELHCVEKFPNVYVVKFFNNTRGQDGYFELCVRIFGKLSL